MSADSWSNYWQGREAQQAGALTGVESDNELQGHWAGVLRAGAPDQPFLDLACGAGTVLKQAAALGYSDLTGLDYSEEATRVVAASFPGVKTVTASAAHTGLAEGSFVMIVSQFGLEYAGAEAAFAEAARLTAAGGTIETVLHMTGGGIETEVKGHVAHCEALLQSGFIETAKALFTAAYAEDAATVQALMGPMVQARDAVSALVKPGQRSLAAHMIVGTGQLWEKRSAYALEDVIGWLSGIEAEIVAYKARMDGMVEAALDGDTLAKCEALLSARGFSVKTAVLSLSGAPAAWTLSARKL